MKRIFVPTQSGADWQRLLAKPALHWKAGASAMTAAACWESAGDSLPVEIAALLESAGDPLLAGQRLIAAMPEWSTVLPGGNTTSQTDVLAICRNIAGLCILAVEAKVHEDFGPTVGSKRGEGVSLGQSERLDYLHKLLGRNRFDDHIRYQLLHRTAAALLTAQEFHARAAVMLVHAFDAPEDRRGDFLTFAAALHGMECARNVFKVTRDEGPALFLAWCDGNATFRAALLPGRA